MDKRKYEGPPKTPIEMIEILPGDKQKAAVDFIDLGTELGCGEQTRYAHSGGYWRCVFLKNKPKRVLFTVECSDKWWRVKAMLQNIERYKEIVLSCSENLIKIIKNAYDCKDDCGHCKGGTPFILDNVEYKKCRGCSFYFRELDNEDCKSLIGLLKEEVKY